ncbi:MAG TPA: MarR family transcriptional regulator [Candidatus Limnocylindrales bacterium]|nr:MarR family transcriptional regulator [Candidatus Limnocylindrales bacterium]
MTPQQTRKPDTRVETVVDAYERFMQLISVGHAPELVELSLSMAQMKVLYVLWARREIQMSELVPVLGVSLSTVSGLVDRLVEAGLAGRRDDPADRRHVVVAITGRGIELMDRFRELGLTQFRALISGLDAGELDLVRRCIDILATAASRKDHP